MMKQSPLSDVFTESKRSQVMSRIRGQENKDTELALITLFRRHRVTGWRRRQKIYGRPDFVFPKLKLAVFVDGCFWHSCPSHLNLPVNNREFWEGKFKSNKKRDRLVNVTLRSRGWHVFRIWEHELKIGNRDRLIRRITRTLAIASARQGRD